MVLTPEDVIKRTFPSTHLRRGYEENPVDDFLDEVVVELRRLNAELDEARAGGSPADAGAEASDASALPGVESDGEPVTDEERTAYEARIAELEGELELAGTGSGGSTVVSDAGSTTPESAAESDALRAEVEDLKARLAAAEAAGTPTATEEGAAPAGADPEQVARLESEVEELRAEVAQAHADKEAALAQVAAVADQPVADPSAAATEAGTSAAAVLTRAQRLHDEMVAEGEATKTSLVTEGEGYRERVVAEADTKATELVDAGQFRHDELIATGQSRHDELISTGQSRHDDLVSDGEQTRTRVLSETESAKSAVLADLGRQRGGLETRIRELGDFESQYRSRLGEWLGTQVAALEAGVGLAAPEGIDAPADAESEPAGEQAGEPDPGQVRSAD